MNRFPPNAEFAQYRFVRDAAGNVVKLPASGPDEKVLLALDCERWGLARLRIYEGAATWPEKLAAFEEEIRLASGIDSGSVARLLSWGRDGEELFYADAMLDGEPLPAYLERAGKVPVATASRWILGFLDLFGSMERLPSSVAGLATLNFEVVRDRQGSVRLVFSEFQGWSRPGAAVGGRRLEWSLAQVFCSLVSGVPVRYFRRDTLPRNFDELPSTIREAVLAALDEERSDALEILREALRCGGGGEDDGADGELAPLPRMPLREWFRHELEISPEAEQNLPETPELGEGAYAIPTRLRGVAAKLQLLPGPVSLPREGWLEQHHDATRRPGRGKVHQLQVHSIEDLASVTLVGEEQVEGVDLASLLGRTGPLDVESAAVLGSRIDSALDALEGRVGARAVWWLPPENVFLLTGTRSLDGSAGFVGRKGGEAWSELPLKFRLHQTLDTLMAGVDLPSKARDCSRLPGKPFEAARRSAIALPILWRAVTGTEFRWNHEAAHPLLPATFAARFEECRVRLRDVPEEVDSNFFRLFPSLPAEEAQEAVDESATDDVAPPEEASAEAAVAELLYEGEIDFAKEAESETLDAPVDVVAADEAAEPAALDESVATEPAETDEAEQEEIPAPAVELPGRRTAFPWLRIVLSATVLSAAVGYGLAEWNRQLGPCRASADPVFALPEFRLDDSGLETTAKSELGEFLLAEGSAQSLRLLPLLERLDRETSRREIEPWLRERFETGDVAAARALGFLALAIGEPKSAGEWFLEAARKGDAESGYRYVALSWDVEKKAFPDPEAVDFLKGAAHAGHPAARELLAHVLVGTGDFEGAFESMRRSAEQGWVPAIHQLGVLHANGLGCPPDRALAAEQFRRAAELGDERAMYDYGRCLAEGYGVPPAYPEALRWMRLASDRGHGAALRWLLDHGVSR